MDNTSLVKFIRLSPMVNGLEALSDYVRRVAYEKRLSYREIAKRAGQRISHGTVSDIINRRSKDIKAETLKALALGLGVTEEEVFAIARGKSISDDLQLNEVKLVNAFRTLPADKQDDVIAYVEMMRIRYGSELDGHSNVGECPVYKAIAGTTQTGIGKKQKR